MERGGLILLEEGGVFKEGVGRVEVLGYFFVSFDLRFGFVRLDRLYLVLAVFFGDSR